SPGIHDVHMNQGSSGSFLNNGRDDHNDHNEIWQDGAVIVDFGQPECSAYFTAFTQQMVPTDDLGNPEKQSHEIQDSDPGSLDGNYRTVPAGLERSHIATIPIEGSHMAKKSTKKATTRSTKSPAVPPVTPGGPRFAQPKLTPDPSKFRTAHDEKGDDAA